MKSQQANPPNSRPLFQLQLRLGSEIIPIQVLPTDDRHTLTDRVCRDHRIDLHYRQLIQNKILDALTKMMRGEGVSATLRSKIEGFLEGAVGEEEGRQEQVVRSPARVLANSPYTMGDVTGVGQEKGYSIQGEHQNSPLSSDHPNEQNACPTPKTEEIRHKRNGVPPPTPSKITKTSQDATTNLQKSTKSHTNKPKWQPHGQQTQFDKDLLTAYKSVYTKCKNPQMKQMVKKIIAELETKQSYSLLPHHVKPFTELNNSSYVKGNSNQKEQRSRSRSSLDMKHPTPLTDPPKPIPQEPKAHQRRLPPKPVQQPQYNYEVNTKNVNSRNGLKANPFDSTRECRQPIQGVYERRYARRPSDYGLYNRQTSFEQSKSRNSLSKYISGGEYTAKIPPCSAQNLGEYEKVRVPVVEMRTPKAYVTITPKSSVTAQVTITNQPQRTNIPAIYERSAQFPAQRTIFNINIERNSSRERIGMNTSFQQASSTQPLCYTFSKQSQMQGRHQRRFKYLQQGSC